MSPITRSHQTAELVTLSLWATGGTLDFGLAPQRSPGMRPALGLGPVHPALNIGQAVDRLTTADQGHRSTARSVSRRLVFRLFTDGVTRPIYQDEQGQYVLEDGERIDGVFLPREEGCRRTSHRQLGTERIGARPEARS